MARDDSSGESSQDGPPYPEARRVYRILGWTHAPVFAGILAVPAYQNGHLGWAIAGGLFGGLVTLAVFYRLAEDHYQGDVPGEPGALIHRGDEDG